MVLGLFVTGKVGPMTLVDRADARADKTLAAITAITEDVRDLTSAVKELATKVDYLTRRGE